MPGRSTVHKMVLTLRIHTLVSFMPLFFVTPHCQHHYPHLGCRQLDWNPLGAIHRALHIGSDAYALLMPTNCTSEFTMHLLVHARRPWVYQCQQPRRIRIVPRSSPQRMGRRGLA